MSYRKGKVFVICHEPEGICELCGRKAEVRPYGEKGAKICVDCAEVDPLETVTRMLMRMFGYSREVAVERAKKQLARKSKRAKR